MSIETTLFDKPRKPKSAPRQLYRDTSGGLLGGIARQHAKLKSANPNSPRIRPSLAPITALKGDRP